MATNHTQTAGGEFPEDPEELLPEESVLSLDEYLAMHAAVGHRTRYEILYRLVHGGDMSPKELEGVIGIDDDSTSTTTSTNLLMWASSKNASRPSGAKMACIRTTERQCSEK